MHWAPRRVSDCGQRCDGGRRVWLLAGAASLAAIAMAAATSASSTAAAAGSQLTIADVAPFTGPDAALGPTYLVSCDAATNAINSAGGVLGHTLGCKGVDTRGDPADAVPAVRQMYASNSNIALVIGCTSDEAASVVPIFGANKTVSFCMTGQSEFDQRQVPVLLPSRPTGPVGVLRDGRDRARTSSTTSGSRSRSATTSARRPSSSRRSQAIKKAGETLSANETLDLSATTFRTEAAAIVNSKPDVILTEALGPTEAAFLSEVKQLNGGKMIPVIGTSATISPDWFKSVSAAVGASNARVQLLGRQPRGRDERARVQRVLEGDLRREGQGRAAPGDFSTYLTAPGAVHLYDGINLAALAMIESKSTIGDRLQGGHREDRRRGSRRDGRLLVRAGRRGAQGGQADPLRRPGRPDELRRVPRLDRALPGRPLHRQRDRQGHGEPVDQRAARARPLTRPMRTTA